MLIAAAVTGLAAIGFAIAAVVTGRKSGWLGEAVVTPISAAAAAVGQLVRVAGTVQPGPAGPVQGPMSQQSMVWWSMRIEEEWRERTQNSQGRSQTRTRRQVLEQEQSTAPFTLVDAQNSSANLLVDGREVDVDEATVTFHDREGGSFRGNVAIGGTNVSLGRGGQSRQIQREWGLAPGTPVEAVGTVATTGDGVQLVDGDRGGLIVTTRTIDALVARTRRMSMLFWTIAVIAVVVAIGLVAAA